MVETQPRDGDDRDALAISLILISLRQEYKSNACRRSATTFRKTLCEQSAKIAPHRLPNSRSVMIPFDRTAFEG
jgi:hypothetical protein